MKKALLFSAILVAAVSCTDVWGPAETPTTPLAADGIDIVLHEKDAADPAVAPDSLVITLTPRGEAAYYSYLVDDSGSDLSASLDAATIYSNGYSSVASGLFKYDAENPSATVTIPVEDLTTYYVYAVSSSVEGNVSEIFSAYCTTSDTKAPEVVNDGESYNYAFEDNLVAFQMTEPVYYNDGYILVAYYARYSQNILYAEPEGYYYTDDIALEIQGDIVTLTLNDAVPHSAFYTLSIPEGFFVDAAGNPSVELSSALMYHSDYGIVYAGIAGQRDPQPFSIAPYEETLLGNWEDPIAAAVNLENDMYAVSSSTPCTVTYANSSRTTEINLVAGQDFDVFSNWSGTELQVYLPEEPARGDNVTVSISEDTIMDIYGNSNEAWSASILYAYDYVLSDAIGTYYFLGYDNWDGYIESSLVIEASDDETQGNIMITNFLGLDCAVYGEFDTIAGTLTFPGFNILGAGAYIYALESYGGDDLVFHMTSAGFIESPSDYFGVYAYDASTEEGLGWIYLFLDAAAMIESTEGYSAAVTAVPASVTGMEIHAAADKHDVVINKPATIDLNIR